MENNNWFHNGASDGRFFPLVRSAASSSPSRSAGDNNCIHHTVSKFDTLPGIAIKYGVQVSDIKRLNGLTADFQMFALKTLQIPSGGCPPSPDSSCNVHTTPQRQPPSTATAGEGFQMATYRVDGHVEAGDGQPYTNPPLAHHRRSKSIASGLMLSGNNHLDPPSQEAEIGSGGGSDRLVRRRQKSVPDFSCYPPPEKVQKEAPAPGTVSAVAGKRVALRSKSSSGRADGEWGGGQMIPAADGFPNDIGVRNCDGGSLSSIFPASVWSLKQDFQAISSPIFDGLQQKPAGRRNKAAID
ncbi:uncharacterized protein LOC127245616 isoform X2 [Andrographis paniculata]|uniref:uncharacterized protein LOC127245616 isoform X2 n=1 Tax=Andrographis paniculata TaxID=175694 RepID=UPI0021E7B03B|nr:uncharacterized protein LOC127245616 isoform X2 [Andrographis paniculata]